MNRWGEWPCIVCYACMIWMICWQLEHHTWMQKSTRWRGDAICLFPIPPYYGSRSGGLGSPGDSVFFKTRGRWEAPGELGVFNGSWSPPVSQTILLLVLRGTVPPYYVLGLHISEAGWFQDPKCSNWVHSHFSISGPSQAIVFPKKKTSNT